MISFVTLFLTFCRKRYGSSSPLPNTTTPQSVDASPNTEPAPVADTQNHTEFFEDDKDSSDEE